MSSVTPIDIILFVVFIVLGLGIAACIARFCCCCSPAMKKGSDKAAEEGRTFASTKESDNQSSEGLCGRVLVRWAIAIPFVIVISIILTWIMFAILAAAGLGSSLLFAPKAATECGTNCTYSSKNGLDGWVDEACCTYDERLPGMNDVWLESASQPDNGKIHGYLMMNNTQAYFGQGRTYILYNHGSGMNVAAGYRLRKYEWLLSLGNIAILSYDYAGYGKSGGTTDGDTVLHSAEVAADFFSNWTIGGGMTTAGLGTENEPISVSAVSSGTCGDSSNIVFLGESMGGTVASYLVNKCQGTPKGLMVMATFLSLSRLSRDYFPLAGFVLGGITEGQFPDFNLEANLEAAPDGLCRHHAHSPDDEWVNYETNAVAINKISTGKNVTCSIFVELEAGTIHTQPFTAAQKASMSTWLESRR